MFAQREKSAHLRVANNNIYFEEINSTGDTTLMAACPIRIPKRNINRQCNPLRSPLSALTTAGLKREGAVLDHDPYEPKS